MLGGDDVRSQGQEFGRQAGRQGLGQWQFLQGKTAWRQFKGRADQQRQGVDLRRTCLFELRHQGRSLLPEEFHLRQIQLRTGPQFGAPPENAQRFGAAFLCQPGQLQAFVTFAQRQIGIGNLRDQTHRGGMTGGIGRQIILQRRFVQMGNTAPEVDFPRSKADTGLILAVNPRTARHAQAFRHAGTIGRHAGRDGRQAVGTLDAIGGAGFLNAQEGAPEITAVGQRLADQAAQFGISKMALPAKAAGLNPGLCPDTVIVCRNRQGGRGKIALKPGTARHEAGEHQERQSTQKSETRSHGSSFHGRGSSFHIIYRLVGI